MPPPHFKGPTMGLKRGGRKNILHDLFMKGPTKMKKVLSEGTKYIFGVFGIAILGLLMTLTYQALGLIFPQSFTNQIWGLVLFDIAAICWALAFVFASETVHQYAVAGIGFLTGFIGTLIMVASEVMLSGQKLVAADQAQIGQWMVYGFIGATVIHASLIYIHHATGQDIKQRIDVGIARGEITTEAIKQATSQLDVEKAHLAHTITQDIVSQVKRDLGLYPIEGTPFEKKDAIAEIPTLPLSHTDQRSDEHQQQDKPAAAQAPFPGPDDQTSSSAS